MPHGKRRINNNKLATDTVERGGVFVLLTKAYDSSVNEKKVSSHFRRGL